MQVAAALLLHLASRAPLPQPAHTQTVPHHRCHGISAPHHWCHGSLGCRRLMNGLMNIPQLEFLLVKGENELCKSLLLCYCILQVAP